MNAIRPAACLMSFTDNLGELTADNGIAYDNRVTSLVCTQGLIPRKVVL